MPGEGEGAYERLAYVHAFPGLSVVGNARDSRRSSLTADNSPRCS